MPWANAAIKEYLQKSRLAPERRAAAEKCLRERFEQAADVGRQIIALIYGKFEDGKPFWVFAAVKPSKYQAMLAAHKSGKLDMYHFEPYGEIIISGDGKRPPDEIVRRVAELYQTSPQALLQSMQEGDTEEKP
jgi:hypothetical protein